MFKIDLSSYSQKFLKKADNELVDRIIKKLKELAIEPFPQDCKRVVGRKEKVFRVRVGGYRILYVIFNDKNKILISEIDKREKAY